MIIGFKAWQDWGKTSLMVKTMLWLMAWGGYEPREVFSNVKVEIEGFQYRSSEGLAEALRVMSLKRVQHKVIGIDEADTVLSHRFWADKKQTEALLVLWKDIKMFNWFLWTAHRGPSVDVLLREATQVLVVPRYNRVTGNTKAGIIYSPNQISREAIFPNIRKLFEEKMYDRWAPVE